MFNLYWIQLIVKRLEMKIQYKCHVCCLIVQLESKAISILYTVLYCIRYMQQMRYQSISSVLRHLFAWKSVVAELWKPVACVFAIQDVKAQLLLGFMQRFRIPNSSFSTTSAGLIQISCSLSNINVYYVSVVMTLGDISCRL